MHLLIRILLALHLAGIVMMAGTTMIDYLSFKTFWKLTDQGDMRALGLIPLMAKYGTFIRIGGALIIITGIVMLSIEKGIWASQLWFKVKIVLVFLLLINGLFVGNTNGHKFREIVSANSTDFAQQTLVIRESLNKFYPIQLTLFVLIILTSMIRFDKLVG